MKHRFAIEQVRKENIDAAIIGLFGLLVGMQPACASKHPDVEHPGDHPAGDHPPGSVHWTYQGESGPEHWAELDPAFAACATGKHQSPIDITAPFEAGARDLTLKYTPSVARLVNNGHTIQVNLAGESTLGTADKTYRLVQFHFHTPSEEALDGKHRPLVAHLVHMSQAGELAVVAVLFDKGADNQTLASVFAALPDKEGQEIALEKPLDPAALLPSSLAYYSFDGSLTTPPCSEGVRWFVLQTPAAISDAQLARFTALFPANARPVQPRNDRPIRAAP